MNFDFPDVDLKFDIEHAERGEVFYLCFLWDGRYRKVAGANQAGLFAAAQILVAQFEIEPQTDEASITPYELFASALENAREIDDVLMILGSRRLAYTTLRKGHQLYADIGGNTCVLEPGPKSNRVYPLTGHNTVLTNNLFERQQVRAAAAMQRLGVDRYQIAHQWIDERGVNFTVKDGLELLRRTQLTRGRFTTQCSMVVDPGEATIYLSLKRDFQHIWKINMTERTVHSLNDGLKACIPTGGLTSADFVSPQGNPCYPGEGKW
jgi:Linear amide C-N hydrolases, choloylglycine hydrolase family